MKMKKHIAIILGLALLTLSCSDWLDVNPAQQIREQEMFETQRGFQDLLMGVYIRMASPALYGRNTTVVLPELMTHHWLARTNDNQLSAAVRNFDFTQTASRNLLETIWLNYFSAIVNLNAILANIEQRRHLFSSGNFELVKGEALGLRAFLHFEILRLWGSAPEQMVLGNRSIPYVTQVTRNPADLMSLTYDEVLYRILADLNAAQELLANDPIQDWTNTELNSPGALGGTATGMEGVDNFHFFRQFRFNLYAVKATKARYFMWIGEPVRAREYAMMVINAQNPDGSSRFVLGNEFEVSMGRLTFPSEHIFALNNSLATQTLAPVFFEHNTAYTQAPTSTDLLSQESGTDIRLRDNRMWEYRVIPGQAQRFNTFRKFNVTEHTAIENMPIIRLSEMFFIAIEVDHTADDLLRTFAISRDILNLIEGEDHSDPEVLFRRLEWEHRKEFFGEGQMLFFNKRHGITEFTWPATRTMTLENYRLPIPETQSMFEL